MDGWNWTWKNVELASSTAEQLAREFQAGVFEEALRHVEWCVSGSDERTRLSFGRVAKKKTDSTKTDSTKTDSTKTDSTKNGDAPRDESRRHESRRHDSRRHDSRRHDSRRHDSRRHDSRRHDSRRHDSRRHHSIRAAQQPSPQDFGLLIKLGELYARLGWLEKCREVKLLLSRIYPDDPLYLYNLACSHSLLGEIDQAFDALNRAIARGYDNLTFLQADEDLDNLKGDLRFSRLVKELESSN